MPRRERRLLGILRTGDEEGTAAPQPRLSDLAALVERVSESGLRVSLTIEGESRPVAPGVELSAFRLVQESLTNVVKHASARTAAVVVRFEDQWLEVRVTDDGAGTASASHSSGHGQVGMRERVSLFGGELSVGLGEPIGYLVRARFPIAAKGGRA